MLTAGDEFGRTQRGNNNAYCHDSPLTWLAWDAESRPRSAPDLLATTTCLIRLRAENPALRPTRYDRPHEDVPNSSQMDWFTADGERMDLDDWNSPAERTLQYLAASTPVTEAPNTILLVVHAHESDVEVVLAEQAGVTGYTLLWDSADEAPTDAATGHAPGDRITMTGPSMRLYRARGST
jgi:glycogen operon protein